MKLVQDIPLRRFNDFLSVLIVLLALYVVILPFLPAASWWTQNQAPLISKSNPTTVAVNEPAPAGNTLVIPKMNLREQVYDGNIGALNKGIWHIPGSSSPDKNSNTVFAGHRFTYSGKAVFYSLDKVAVSDNMTLYWEGKRYDYIVTAINEVSPTNGSLVEPTETSTLTVYTCTPVWSAKNRLVITAKLVEVKS